MAETLLLTGPPGCGKTTAIRAALAGLGCRTGGFYTREVRREGKRIGFEIVTLDGLTGWLARTDLPGPARVGRYGVDLDSLERLGVTAVWRALERADLVVIDEIGPMEVLSGAFREVVRQVLAGKTPLLGSLASRPAPFPDEVRAHPGVALLKVTKQNRDGIVTEVLRRLRRLGLH